LLVSTEVSRDPGDGLAQLLEMTSLHRRVDLAAWLAAARSCELRHAQPASSAVRSAGAQNPLESMTCGQAFETKDD
jgi:hypothetical protein